VDGIWGGRVRTVLALLQFIQTNDISTPDSLGAVKTPRRETTTPVPRLSVNFSFFNDRQT